METHSYTSSSSFHFIIEILSWVKTDKFFRISPQNCNQGWFKRKLPILFKVGLVFKTSFKKVGTFNIEHVQKADQFFVFSIAFMGFFILAFKKSSNICV